MFELAKLAYNAIPRFLETIESMKAKGNDQLEILATLSNACRSDNKELLELVKEDYPEFMFKITIFRKAAIRRILVYGL